jgi:hypothetical protein
MTAYETPCPIALDARHAWKVEPLVSSRVRFRFSCSCGAWGWREGKAQEVRQYAPDSKWLRLAMESREKATLRPPTITAQQHPGRNETGHRLPAGSTMEAGRRVRPLR